jgi:hypothetical protein
MRKPFDSAAGPLLHRNVGREDRLVRGCIALAMLLLGGFAVALSGELGPFSILLVLMLGYFAGTAVVGWDPLYTWGGIDTRTDAELGLVEVWPTEPPWQPHAVLDLTDGARSLDSAQPQA